MAAQSRTLPGLDTPVHAVARTDFVRLYETETVGEALARLREEEIGERIIYFYVTDGEGKLVGVVPTRRLLLAAPATLVRRIMIGDVISIRESASFREALQQLTIRRILALPVVDAEGVLRGVIDVGHYAQDAFDIERREEAEEVFQLVGIHIEQERRAGILGSFRIRFPWLLCNLGSGLACAFITGVFGESLKTAMELAFFIPVVLALAESVGIQSLTLALQSFQVSSVGAFHVAGMPQNFAVGSLIGVAGGAIIAVVAAGWLEAFIGAVVFGGALAAAVIGAVVGYLLPRVIRRWQLDPKVASGPAVLALADLLTLSAYLGFASVLMK